MVLTVLALLNIGAVLAAIFGLLSNAWILTFPLYAATYFLLARNNPAVFSEASHLQDALRQLAEVFRVLEAYNYAGAPYLAELCRDFREPTRRPSTALARISRVADATGIQGNPLIWVLLNLTVPWDYFFALRLTTLKGEVAEFMPGWLASWFEIEALGSLANLGYLNPAYAYPTVVADLTGPIFAAQARATRCCRTRPRSSTISPSSIWATSRC